MQQAGPRIDRVLLVTSHDGLRAEASALLQSLGHHVSTLAQPGDADAYLRRQRVELVIVDVPRDASPGDAWHLWMHALASRRDASAPRLLLLTRARSSDELRQLFDHGELTNFLVVKDDDTVDAVELMVTVAKILSGEVFGLHQYIGANGQERSFTLHASTQKADAIEMAEACALEAGCNARIAKNIAAVVDELVTNALYNAPVDENGTHIYAHLDRRIPVHLEPGRGVIVRFAWDEQRFGLSAEDSYGSLDRDKVLSYMKKCFAGGEKQIDDKEGGAGIGLYMIFNLVNHFVVNLAPGVRSEALGLVSVSSSYKRVVSQGRSFNLFVARPSARGTAPR